MRIISYITYIIVCLGVVIALTLRIDQQPYDLESAYILQNDQTIYYGKSRKEVLATLPTPSVDDLMLLTLDDCNYSVLMDPYYEELRASGDSTMQIYCSRWHDLPSKERPDLLIFFTQIDSTWIATEVIEYNSTKVLFD